MRQPSSHTSNTRINSAKQHQFAEVPHANIQRSTFDRSHGLKTTFNAGDLIPIFVDEALPGDSFSLNMTAFARLSTPIYPIMDNMFMDTHFFSVPVRLVWDGWQTFMGETTDIPDFTVSALTVPTITAPVTTGEAELSLADYLGIPTKVPELEYNALHNRAYNLVWNEWFRDQNLQDSLTVDKSNGPDTTTYSVQKRGKRHDYFTSALPWPQKGADVTLPLGTTAPLTTDIGAGGIVTVYDSVASDWKYLDASSTQLKVDVGASGTDARHLYADLTNATSATINQLRLAFATQKFLEKQARGGTRYIEVIKSHFNVTSPDARLQRPEYLGGGSSAVNISPIAQTTSTDATSPQGNLAAIGTTVLSGHGFTKSFTEHSLLIGLVSVRADLTYQQGLNRMFSRQTIYDYFWPTLSTIGEQAVLNKEIYAQGSVAPTADEATFGYQERYAEYRYKPSTITGRFRSNAAASLDVWHLAEEYSVLPELGSSFIEVPNSNIQRTLAVATEPQFIFDSLFKLNCTRPMPVNSIPGGTNF